jgi:alanine dehydrogenase
LANGVNAHGGHITNGPVAEFLGVEMVDPLVALA